MQKHGMRVIGYAGIAVIIALLIVFGFQYLHLGNHVSDAILAAVLTALIIIILSGRMSTM